MGNYGFATVMKALEMPTDAPIDRAVMFALFDAGRQVQSSVCADTLRLVLHAERV